jgi:hypothetical protein
MEATCWHGEHDIRVRRTRHMGRERSGSRHSRFARRYCLYHNDGDLRFRLPIICGSDLLSMMASFPETHPKDIRHFMTRMMGASRWL